MKKIEIHTHFTFYRSFPTVSQVVGETVERDRETEEGHGVEPERERERVGRETEKDRGTARGKRERE